MRDWKTTALPPGNGDPGHGVETMDLQTVHGTKVGTFFGRMTMRLGFSDRGKPQIPAPKIFQLPSPEAWRSYFGMKNPISWLILQPLDNILGEPEFRE